MSLCRIDALNGPWPLLDVAAARRHEAEALGDHAPGALMGLAGLAVARLALAAWPHARRITVWAGPGNNGGDGLVAARHLHEAGFTVRVRLAGDTPTRPPDAAAALAAARAAGVPMAPAGHGSLDDADLHIDALLGLGALRPPDGEVAAAIAAIRRAASPVLAVDLPSGLAADTGACLGDHAVRAEATLSLLALKPGCFTHQGRDHAGTVWLDDLGHPAPGAAATAWLSGPPTSHPRPHDSHKGRYGDVGVVGGDRGMAGAALLAAQAALAAGAGRVYVSLLDPQAHATTRPELMTHAAWWLQAPDRLRATTTVAGCGGGQAVRAALPPLLSQAGRLVLDADALNAVADDAALLALLRMRQTRGLGTLLTPHPLEAARLLGTSTAEVQCDRLGAARQLAQHTGATVLLKGSGSVMAAADGARWINPSGNAALATPGTGDVLAGWAAGRWSATPGSDAVQVACESAWQHGWAADRYLAAHPAGPGCARGPLRAVDLIEALASG